MKLEIILARQAAQQEAYKKSQSEAKAKVEAEAESPEWLAYKKAHSSSFPTEASIEIATHLLEEAEKEAKWLESHDDGL